MAVQWPFADFPDVAGARNWFFGTIYFDYNLHPTSITRATCSFRSKRPRAVLEGNDGWRWRAAVLTTRLGIGLGRLDANESGASYRPVPRMES